MLWESTKQFSILYLKFKFNLKLRVLYLIWQSYSRDSRHTVYHKHPHFIKISETLSTEVLKEFQDMDNKEST